MEKTHILLIENDENELEFFTNALAESKLHFLCSTARSTEQAFKMLKNIVPDIVFLDMDISKVSGKNFLKKIKEIVNLQNIPVIMYSNVPDAKEKNSIDHGTENYLHLPGNVQTLASMLNNLLKAN